MVFRLFINYVDTNSDIEKKKNKSTYDPVIFNQKLKFTIFYDAINCNFQ